MKVGLGDAVAEGSLALEAAIAEKFEFPGAFLGNLIVDQALKIHLPPTGCRLYRWWKGTRNAILHRGITEYSEAKHQQIRDTMEPTHIREIARLLVSIINAQGMDADEIVVTCKNMLPQEVFHDIFRGYSVVPSTDDGYIVTAPESFVVPHSVDDAESSSNESRNKEARISHPVSIKELAHHLGAEPFEIMRDLIRAGVFPAPDQLLDVATIAKVCELRGFTFVGGE